MRGAMRWLITTASAVSGVLGSSSRFWAGFDQITGGSSPNPARPADAVTFSRWSATNDAALHRSEAEIKVRGPKARSPTATPTTHAPHRSSFVVSR